MKVFGLATAALMMTIGASAGIVSESCGGANSTPGSAVIAPTALTCNQFSALPGGDTPVSLQIEAVDSFDGGNIDNSNNSFDINYSSIIAAIVGLPGGNVPNGCTPGVGGGNSCTDVISGGLSGNSGPSAYDFGDAITAGLATYFGAGTFSVATVTSAIDAGSQANPIGSNGDVTTQLYAILTYSTPTGSAPEPGSMMLLGSGLLAAGLIGRKKLVRK
jgi:hypothetical protein